MAIYFFAALLIGVVAGLRTMTPLAAASWAACLGALDVRGTWLTFMGSYVTAVIFTVAALGELVTDQLPSTPSRKTPIQFVARAASGAVCGAAIGGTGGSWGAGLGAGIVGAVIGTLAGSDFRGRLAQAFRRDQPAAFVEDALAIASAIFIVGILG